MTNPRHPLLRQSEDAELVPDECLCSNSPPDYFGNQHHIVNPACPLCAEGDQDQEEAPRAS